MIKQHIRKQSGFSLVEVSIVLVILAVVISGLLPFITESLRAKEQEETINHMKEIENAILGYALVNGVLPCPSDNTARLNTAAFGDAGTGACPNADYGTGNSFSGGVPIRQLGLPDEVAFDGWGRRFKYQVSANNVDTGSLANSGQLTIQDTNTNPRTTQASFALVSHGPQGHGAYLRSGATRDGAGNPRAIELENCDCGTDGTPVWTDYDDTLVQGARIDSDDVAQIFDDVVRYMTSAQIRAKIGIGAGTIRTCTNAETSTDAACIAAATNSGGGNGSYRAISCRVATGARGDLQWTGAAWQDSSATNCVDGTVLVTPLP